MIINQSAIKSYDTRNRGYLEVSMMKKIIVSVSVILFFMTTGCELISNLLDLPDDSTKFWQTVSVDGIGSFKVPVEWSIERQNEVLYITDTPQDNEDYEIYLVGVLRNDKVEAQYTHPHELFDGV